MKCCSRYNGTHYKGATAIYASLLCIESNISDCVKKILADLLNAMLKTLWSRLHSAYINNIKTRTICEVESRIKYAVLKRATTWVVFRLYLANAKCMRRITQLPHYAKNDDLSLTICHSVLFNVSFTNGMVSLTHCSLVMPYSNIELDQHWLK